MPLSHIEHILLQTDDIERTCDWYERVLGMRRGPQPGLRAAGL
jgi:catechol 2,3-dioxygenase-like lactoylglutathione lyase family enzyme